MSGEYPYEDAPRLPAEGELNPRDWLKADGPIELEIGPGRGWFMVERAEHDENVNLLGLEIRRKWATLVDRRLASRGYGARARVFAEDARLVLPRFVPDCLQTVYVHFPDPWWKKRHQKRLVVSDAVNQEIVRLLVPGGHLFVQTDVHDRAEAYFELLSQIPELKPAGSEGPWLEESPYQARSPRERKAIEDGLPVHRLRYERCG